MTEKTSPRPRETYAELHNAQLRRQMILDHLIAHPQTTFYELAAALAAHWSEFGLRGALGGMQTRGEIAYTGKPRNRQYTALVTATLSAEEIITRHRDKNRRAYQKRIADLPPKSPRGAQAAAANDEPWRYVHKPGQSRSEGGQGAVRARVYVNCQQNY